MADNVEAVANAFAALRQGDLSRFSPGYTHLGYDINGRPQIFDGLGPCAEMMAKCAQTFEVFEAEFLSATAVDDELAIASWPSIGGP